MSEAEEMAKRLERNDEFEPLGFVGWEAASLLRSQAAKIEALNQEVSDKCDSINVWRAKCVEAEEALKAQLATARNDALEEAARVAEATRADMESIPIVSTATRSAIAAAIRAMKEG